MSAKDNMATFQKDRSSSPSSTTLTSMSAKDNMAAKKPRLENAGVAQVLNDALLNVQAPSPFTSGQPAGASSSSSSSDDIARVYNALDANRVEELRSLKLQILQLQQAQANALPTTVVGLPAPTMATPAPEILEFFKAIEAARLKSAAEASAIQVAARKEDLKSMETLSKKLAKKDDSEKHNLKQTAIILGTAEALSVLSEGLFSCLLY